MSLNKYSYQCGSCPACNDIYNILTIQLTDPGLHNVREEEQVDSEANNFNSTNQESPIKPENKTLIKVEDETLQPLFPCEVKECTACFTTQLDLKVSEKIVTKKH